MKYTKGMTRQVEVQRNRRVTMEKKVATVNTAAALSLGTGTEASSER